MNDEYIQSQYSNSPTIKQLLNDFKDNINPNNDINEFYENIMDVDSAIGIGLDIIGKIIGASRTLEIDENKIILSDNIYRNYIKFKMLANISESTLEFLNKINYILYNNTNLTAANVINEGTLNNGDKYNTTPMKVRFTWRTNSISSEKRAIFMQGILFCLAAGVGWDLQIISQDDNIFGFAGSGLQPFNQGVFVNIQTRDKEEENISDGNS